MDAGNYILLFKGLGKICKVWDDAAASEASMQVLGERTIEQIADQETWELDQLFGAQLNAFGRSITAGPTAIKAWAVGMAESYLKSDTVKAYFAHSTIPANPSGTQMVQAILDEMLASTGDNKTLTTKGSTGLVNFFDDNWTTTGTWNTAGSPDYADSVYVVATIVT